MQLVSVKLWPHGNQTGIWRSLIQSVCLIVIVSDEELFPRGLEVTGCSCLSSLPKGILTMATPPWQPHHVTCRLSPLKHLYENSPLGPCDRVVEACPDTKLYRVVEACPDTNLYRVVEACPDTNLYRVELYYYL